MAYSASETASFSNKKHFGERNSRAAWTENSLNTYKKWCELSETQNLDDQRNIALVSASIPRLRRQTQ